MELLAIVIGLVIGGVYFARLWGKAHPGGCLTVLFGVGATFLPLLALYGILQVLAAARLYPIVIFLGIAVVGALLWYAYHLIRVWYYETFIPWQDIEDMRQAVWDEVDRLPAPTEEEISLAESRSGYFAKAYIAEADSPGERERRRHECWRYHTYRRLFREKHGRHMPNGTDFWPPLQ